ncbi:MAG: hypothetical protein EA406_01285 [Rhodospirillales bacterium]|nr:MAG: hypothetical protein EA406_01285 [Rhodospirillales bacterium]
MSDDTSRYKDLPTFLVPDASGRAVPVLPPAPRGGERLKGYHRRRDRERLDQLAYVYLKDASGFHRIADLNGAILPDALDQTIEIAIPERQR